MTRCQTLLSISIAAFFAPSLTLVQTPIYDVKSSAPDGHLGMLVHGASDVNLDGMVDFIAVGYSDGTPGITRVLSGLDGSRPLAV